MSTMGVMIPRRNLVLLLIVLALVLTEISPTNGIRCYACGGTTDKSTECDVNEESGFGPTVGSIECTPAQKSCKREFREGDQYDEELTTVSCDTATVADCRNPSAVCVCLTDDCNKIANCGCPTGGDEYGGGGGSGGSSGGGGGGGGGGKGGSGGMDQMDEMDSSQYALIPGAASTLMALMVATFTLFLY